MVAGQTGRLEVVKLRLGNVRFGSQADISLSSINVCFSNRPVGVKRFQTIHDCGVDVAHGLVLLSGLGTKAFEDEESLPRLAVGRSKQTYELTSSIVPRGTPFHRVVEFGFPPMTSNRGHRMSA
jgi:hypothetical protein